MTWLYSYVLRVISCAMIVAIVTGLFAKSSTAGTLVRIIGGLLLLVSILKPLARPLIENWEDWLETFDAEASAAAEQGESFAAETYGAYIKSETEAYILDKARNSGAELSVEVELDAQNVPWAVVLRGTVSPGAKVQLATMIEDTLGIAKERQEWIG